MELLQLSPQLNGLSILLTCRPRGCFLVSLDFLHLPFEAVQFLHNFSHLSIECLGSDLLACTNTPNSTLSPSTSAKVMLYFFSDPAPAISALSSPLFSGSTSPLLMPFPRDSLTALPASASSALSAAPSAPAKRASMATRRHPLPTSCSIRKSLCSVSSANNSSNSSSSKNSSSSSKKSFSAATVLCPHAQQGPLLLPCTSRSTTAHAAAPAQRRCPHLGPQQPELTRHANPHLLCSHTSRAATAPATTRVAALPLLPPEDEEELKQGLCLGSKKQPPAQPRRRSPHRARAQHAAAADLSPTAASSPDPAAGRRLDHRGL